VLFHQFEKVVILGNIAIAEYCKEISENVFDIQTLDYYETTKVMTKSRLAFMTSGLGNMYDAASYARSVIWLPATNVSQGQQLRLLKKHDPCTVSMDWHEFMNCDPLIYDYECTDMSPLGHMMELFEKVGQHTFESFTTKIVSDYTTKYPNGRSFNILKTFGNNGIAVALDAISKFVL